MTGCKEQEKGEKEVKELIPAEFLNFGTDAISQAKSIIIKDQSDYEIAEVMGKVFSDEVKKIKEYFKPKKQKAKEVHSDWVNAEKEAIRPHEEAKIILKKAMIGYEAEQERIRREKEAALRKAAEEKMTESGEDSLIMPEDIVVQPTFQKKGQTRITHEVVITSMSAFLLWLAKSNYSPDEYVTIKTSAVKAIAKEQEIPGVKLEERRIKIF